VDGGAWEFGRYKNAVQLDRALNAADENDQLIELEGVHQLDQTLGLLVFLDAVVVL
jgi:hypothetical protein